MNQHTPEPWNIEPANSIFQNWETPQDWVKGIDGIMVCEPCDSKDAAHIVACVNGCAGLNPAAYRELLKAAKAVLEYWDGVKPEKATISLLALKHHVANAEGGRG